MKKSKRATRRVILSSMYDHLSETYEVYWSREDFVDGQHSMHEIDAFLAFRGDPILGELRSALDRLEDGTYGRCISCKRMISQDVLDADPIRRVCLECERHFNTIIVQPYMTA